MTCYEDHFFIRVMAVISLAGKHRTSPSGSSPITDLKTILTNLPYAYSTKQRTHTFPLSSSPSPTSSKAAHNWAPAQPLSLIVLTTYQSGTDHPGSQIMLKSSKESLSNSLSKVLLSLFYFHFLFMIKEVKKAIC